MFTGVFVTPEVVERVVQSYMDQNTPSIDEQRWQALSPIMSALRTDPALRWASSIDVKNAVEKALTTRYGPKDKQPASVKPTKENKSNKKVSICKEDKENGWRLTMESIAL